MFPDRGQSFNGLKHYGESDSSGITNSCSDYGRPHNAHPTAKINKFKDLALIFWSVTLLHQDFILCQNIISKRFSMYFFTNTHLMRCLSSVVNPIAVTTLLPTSGLHRCQQRIFKKNAKYFMQLESAILFEIFIQIGSFF